MAEGSGETMLAAAVAAVEAVPNVGRVHSRTHLTRMWDDVIKEFKNGRDLRYWEIVLGAPVVSELNWESIEIQHVIEAYGFITMDEAGAHDKILDELAAKVRSRLGDPATFPAANGGLRPPTQIMEKFRVRKKRVALYGVKIVAYPREEVLRAA